MKIIFFPFFRKHVSVIYTLLEEYPELGDEFELYGISPELQYREKKVPSYLVNRSYDLDVTLIGKEEIENITKQDFVVQLGDGFSSAHKNYVSTIKNKFEQKGIEVHDGIEALMHSKGICRKKVNPEEFNNYRHQLQKINTPIIGVGAMVSLQDTAEVMVNVKRNLSSNMKVATIYAHEELSNCSLNCISVSKLETMTFEEKIFYINWYVNKVIENENPDLILIEIPGGLAKLHNRCLNGGGEYPFLYQQAMNISCLICSLPANDIRVFQFDRTTRYMQKKYGFSKIFFHVSNFMIVYDRDIDKDNVHGIFLDEKYISKEICEIRKMNKSIAVYNLLEDKEIRKWCKAV